MLYEFLLLTVIRYNAEDVELPYIVKFPHNVNVQKLICNLVPGLPYTVKLSFSIKFLNL